jgi:hypothetical protein
LRFTETGKLAVHDRVEIAHREQRVLVDGELVVAVELHVAGQIAELRQVRAKQSAVVHVLEDQARAPEVADDLEEQLGGRLVAAHGVGDERQVRADDSLQFE